MSRNASSQPAISQRVLMLPLASTRFNRDNFTNRGIQREGGDSVYIVSIHQGRVYLISRMLVQRVRPRTREDAALWPGDEVIEGVEGTPMRFGRTLSPEVLGRLRFTSRRGDETGLALDDTGRLAELQALRSVRQLATGSAELLDAELAED